MPPDPIFFVGGSGVFDRHAAGNLRAACQEVPLLIGGRYLARAQTIAEGGGAADGVTLESGGV